MPAPLYVVHIHGENACAYSMYACMYACMHVCIWVCASISLNISKYSKIWIINVCRVSASMHVRIFVWQCVYDVSMYFFVRNGLCICVCMSMLTSMPQHVFLWMCLLRMSPFGNILGALEYVFPAWIRINEFYCIWLPSCIDVFICI